jgi:hypothetical protein
VSAVASPWRDAAGALPLRAWSDLQRDAVAAAAARVLAEWERAWGLPASHQAVRCAVAAAECEGGSWQWLGTRGAASAWFERRSSFDALLAQGLWDAPATDAPIARVVQVQCAQDLLARMATALRLERAPLSGTPVPCGGAWSGALALALPWDVAFLLDAAAVASLLAVAVPQPVSTRALVPLQQALAGSAMKLRVHLADCEIAVGGLGELQVGDVLRLRHPLHAPAQVRDADGRALFDASLVRRGGRRAAQLTGAARVPSPTALTGKAVP